MDTTEFLSAVVPAGGKIVLAVPHGKFWRHFTPETYQAAAKTAARLAADHDVYFATGSYKQGFVEKDGRKVFSRKADNVAALASLWLDIDCKGGKTYSDQREGLLALGEFRKKAKLPDPSIVVSSGRGLHVYWLLDTPMEPDAWKRLSVALKGACADLGMKADPVCTADPARVLRVPGTFNRKDPANPLQVRVLYSNGERYSQDDLGTILLPWAPSAQKPPANLADLGLTDLTGGVGAKKEERPSSFEEIKKHCGIAKLHAETHGRDASEPEWVAMLQLLRHCEDGALHVHDVSNGHPSYTEADTDAKWQARMANTVGPTLCRTFEQYRPEICAKCPHSGFIKTPLHLGHGDTQDVSGLPAGWRVAPDGNGIERLMITDPATNTREWIKVLRHMFSGLRITRRPETGEHWFSISVTLKNSETWALHMPTSYLGNLRKLVEEFAAQGIVFKGKEALTFGELMGTWLQKVQQARRVSDTTGQQGWVFSGDKVTGFSCGTTTYYADGREKDDVRPSREFEQIARMYEPKGGLEPWKKVAAFIAEQNNPALTAVLAASFGSPLLKFTGLQGGILSLVSTASGVGKSSVLKTAQAVWGNPTHGMNSVDDTVKSVTKKCGYLNNLPAYWDELRGRETLDNFTPLAFMITQGKDRTRLNQHAELRETSHWELMLIAASNESIFEAMARQTRGTDAGMVRVLELFVDAHPEKVNRAQTTLLFAQLNSNYGHAGRVYAKYLAMNADKVQQMVHDTYVKLGANEFQPQHRFWYGVIACLFVGAKIASELDLVHIDLKTLLKYLMATLKKLDERVSYVSKFSGAEEILSQFFQHYASSILTVDKLPGRKQNTIAYNPLVILEPKTGKLVVQMAMQDRLIRFPQQIFEDYLNKHNLPMMQTIRRLSDELGAVRCRVSLGIGTKWNQPRSRCLEVPLTDNLMEFAISGDSSSPDETPDSHDD